MPVTDGPVPDTLGDQCAEMRAAMATRLEPRMPGVEVHPLLGAGSDDIESGRAYLRSIADTGWVVPTWPSEYGGLGLTGEAASAVRKELSSFRSPDLYPFLVGLLLVGPTLLAHATPEQCARWLPAVLSGEEIWCQMFSEPDAGSDLANLACRATRDGDGWRVSGAKLWTSRAHYSRRGLLLARTDFSVPKHSGITAFALDLEAPGIEISPVRQMNGDAHFAEVFLDEVWVPDADRIGDTRAGWRVALTTLAHERGAGTAGSGTLIDLERLIALIRQRGGADPLLRQELAQVIIETRVFALTVQRASDAVRAGKVPGPEGSGMKLRGSNAFRRYADLATRVLGAAAVAGDDTFGWQVLFLTGPSLGIRGGTDEVQRNVVGERVLGLPAEPRVDRDVPFDRLRRTGGATRA